MGNISQRRKACLKNQKRRIVFRLQPHPGRALVGVLAERDSSATEYIIELANRSTKELRRPSAYQAACVVLEVDLRDILGGWYFSGAHPNAVLADLICVAPFGMPLFFCSDLSA